jgi:hypothetical protein
MLEKDDQEMMATKSNDDIFAQEPPSIVMDKPSQSIDVQPVNQTVSIPLTPMNRESAQVVNPVETRPEGIVMVAIYHFLLGLPGLISGLIIATIPVIAVIRNVADPAALTIALIGLGVAVLLTGGLGLIMLITGNGLLRMRNWARWLAIAFACLSLVFYPMGTITGALILVYLLSERVRKAFTSR